MERSSGAWLLKLISNPINLELLILLSTRQTYTRELARLTGLDETLVSRRLKQLEEAGIVRGEWRRVEGKSVKVYRLEAGEFRIRIDSGRLEVGVRGRRLEVGLPRRLGGPPRVGLLLGRDRELEVLRDPGNSVVIIWGMSGIGKTSLAAKAVEGEERVFWITLTRLDSSEYILWRLGLFLASLGRGALLNYLGNPMSRPDLAADVAVEALKGTRSVLVFDDYHTVDGTLQGKIITRIAMGADGYRVIIVSRSRPRGFRRSPGCRVVEILLSGLERRAAEELLRARGARVSSEEAARIYEETQGHPLLLSLAAQALASGRGEAGDARLDYLWSEVYSNLSPKERRVLTVLAAFNEPVPVDLVEAVSGVANAAVYLLRLRDRGLVEEYSGGFRAHQLVRGLAGEGKRATLLAAARYYEAIGGWAARIRAMRYYLASGRPEEAARLVEARVREDDPSYLNWLHEYAEILARLEKARLPTRLKAYVKHDYGKTLALRGKLREAMEACMQALDLALIAGDPVAEAQTRLDYSFLLSELGRYEDAVAEAERAAELARRLGDARILFGAYANLAKAYAGKGDLGRALETVMEEVRVAGALGDPFYTLWGKIHLAEVYRIMGLTDKARKVLEEARVAAEALGIKHTLAYIWLVTVEVLDAEGEWTELEKAVSAAERLFEEAGVGRVAHSLHYYRARSLAGRGRYREALLEAHLALEMAREANSREGVERIEKLVAWLEGRVEEASRPEPS